jgi:effector-binding domain-containing protein
MAKMTKPKIVQRPEMHFAAVRLQVPIPFGKFIPPAVDEVHTWLAGKRLESPGAPFIRYLTTDMSRKLDIEVGWPVASPVDGDERIVTGTIPAGRYAVMIYTGSFRGKGLYKATSVLLSWAEENQISWQKSEIDGVEWWAARFEHYLTDPVEVPDPAKWETELAFMIAEE